MKKILTFVIITIFCILILATLTVSAGPVKPVTECNDGIDNDGDGKIDTTNYYAFKGLNRFLHIPKDPDCRNWKDNDESQ